MLGAGLVVLIVFGVVGWWLSRGDAPAEADLDTAAASLDQADADADADAGSGSDGGTEADAGSGSGAGADDQEAGSAGEPGPVDIEGQWTVDTSVGEFSFEDSTGTFVGFRVGEELRGVGEIEAVGRTPAVSGTVTVEGRLVTGATIEADLSAITTDDSRRDNKVRGALGTDQFPTATFELTSPIDLGPDALGGDPVAATAAGDLTIKGVSQPVEFDLQAQLVDDTIVIVGALDIAFGDFGVTVPSAPIVLSAEDFGVVELQLFLAHS